MEKGELNKMLIKYGGLAFFIIILFSFLLPLLGASLGLSQNLMIVVLGAEMYLCCREYKSFNHDVISFNQAFTLSLKVSLIAGLLNSFLVFLVISFIGKIVIKEAMYKNKELIYKGNDSEMFFKMTEAFSNPFAIPVLTLIIYLLIGLFLSVLIAFVIKSPVDHLKG